MFEADVGRRSNCKRERKGILGTRTGRGETHKSNKNSPPIKVYVEYPPNRLGRPVKDLPLKDQNLDAVMVWSG
jgi:hypothetical protein